MSVHQAISAHSKKQQEAIQTFLELDREREKSIEEAIVKCKNNEPYSVEQINEITKKINTMATQEIVPTRKYVSLEMIKEVASK